jgi:hypothetical protein
MTRTTTGTPYDGTALDREAGRDAAADAGAPGRGVTAPHSAERCGDALSGVPCPSCGFETARCKAWGCPTRTRPWMACLNYRDNTLDDAE